MSHYEKPSGKKAEKPTEGVKPERTSEQKHCTTLHEAPKGTGRPLKGPLGESGGEARLDLGERPAPRVCTTEMHTGSISEMSFHGQKSPSNERTTVSYARCLCSPEA